MFGKGYTPVGYTPLDSDNIYAPDVGSPMNLILAYTPIGGLHFDYV